MPYLTESVTEPPSPVQVRVNVAALLITIDVEPPVAFAPDQSPDALQLSASVEDQLNVIVPPRRNDDGLAVRLSVGSTAAGGSFTVSVTLSLALPPSLTQLIV